MSKPTPDDLLKMAILSSNESIKYHQGLIDKWNDPKDIAQRAAVVILEIHKMYGKMAFVVLKMIQNNCKHPKKERQLCKDGTVYCMECNGDLSEEQINSVKTPSIIHEAISNRRKFVKKYSKQKMTQNKIAQKLDVSLSTVEKDMASLRTC